LGLQKCEFKTIAKGENEKDLFYVWNIALGIARRLAQAGKRHLLLTPTMGVPKVLGVSL